MSEVETFSMSKGAKRLFDLLTNNVQDSLLSVAREFSDYQLDLLATAVERDIPIIIYSKNTEKDVMFYRLLKAMGVSIVQNYDTVKENNLLVKGIYFSIVLPD